MECMATVPLVVESWQTDTPNLPGTWRRTSMAEGRWDEAQKKWLSEPVLNVDLNTPWLRFEFIREGIRQVFRWPNALLTVMGRSVQPFKVQDEHILQAVVLKDEPPPAGVVMRVPLPKKREAAPFPDAPSKHAPIREKLEHTIRQVHASGAHPEIRAVASEILESFLSKMATSMQEFERAIRNEMHDANYVLPIPAYGGLDGEGRILITFVSPALTSDLYIGQDRKLEVKIQGRFQLPNRASPKDLMGMVFAGGNVVGEA